MPVRRLILLVWLLVWSEHSAMLTVYGRKNSYNLQKVMWLVAELDLPHEHIEKGGSFGGLDTPEFLAMNPHGRVPVIQDGGTVVWESHAILRFLAAMYGRPQFWAEDAETRSHTDRWLDWNATTLQPDFLNGVFWGWFRTPAEKRNMKAVERKIAACSQHMELLDQTIGDKPFLLGNELTLADIAIATSFHRYFNIEISRPNLPRVEAWHRRLEERPGYQQHVMVPFADLFGRLAF